MAPKVKLPKDPQRLPTNHIEWQAAADAAELMLTVDAAKAFGLVDSDLPIDVTKCRNLLTEAELLGITPRPGPATNGGLLAKLIIRGDEAHSATRIKKVGNAAVQISVKCQRIFGSIPEARAIVQLKHPRTRQRVVTVRINEQQLQVHLTAVDRYYTVQIEDLIEQVMLGDGSYTRDDES